jgi:transposase
MAVSNRHTSPFHPPTSLQAARIVLRPSRSRETGDLKRTEFLWLTNPENLSGKQERMLLHVKDLDIKTAKAYQFRLAIQNVWDLPSHQAKEYLKKWIAWVEGCNLPEMSKLAKSIRNHIEGIIESVRQRSPVATPRA